MPRCQLKRPDVRVIAVEPENAAGFRAASRGGEPADVTVQRTITDGLAVARVGRMAFAIAAPRVDEMVTVTESEIARAIALLARGCGAVVEGAGAVAPAALLAEKVRTRVAAVPVCGRNIDARRHGEILNVYPHGCDSVRPAA